MNTALVFGLNADELRPLVAAVTPGSLASREADDGTWADRFARVAWTTLAEPGDAVAGALVESVGAAAALELLLQRSGNGQGAKPDRAWREMLDELALETVSAQMMLAGFSRWAPRLSAVAVIRSLEQSARFGIQCSVPSDTWWPQGLADLGPSSPMALWTRGDQTALVRVASSAAIVGARAATGYGESVAVELAAGLSDRGVLVVSGGAYGIDGSAHRAAVATGASTIAVLAGGLDRLYPVGHDELLRRIATTGALVAEVPCGVPPTRWRFLQRNRVIAAMTGATVVVEAGHRSGSLNTAGHAAAIGRPLGAVPGAITSAASAGCHRLLREYGATCITSAHDVLEMLGVDSSEDPTGDTSGGSAGRRSSSATRVLDAVHQRTARSPGEIAGLTGMAVGEVLAALGILESERVIRRTDSGDWVRSRPASSAHSGISHSR